MEDDAASHLDYQEAELQSPALDCPATTKATRDQLYASAAALASLRRQCLALQKSLQSGIVVDEETVVRRCRQMVLHACRVQWSSHARKARAIVYETTSDCALYLLASGHSVAAASVLRHLLVNLGWNPRSASDLELSQPSISAAAPNHASSLSTITSSAKTVAATRPVLIAQQVISHLTLAPSTSSPRPTRRFESTSHLDAATSLVSAMHFAQMPRSTNSQTAIVRALIASGRTQLAVQTYAAEVRAWWGAHKEARRLRSPLRRQAALTVEIGKPSSQVLREITRALQHLEELLSRVPPELLVELPERERHALSAKRSEFAECLVDLIRLVRGGRLPLPPAASAPEITWILSACCRFETTVLLNNAVATDATVPGSFDATEKRKLQGAADVIRYYLREYMQSLPDGQTRSAGNLLIGGAPVVRPAVGIAVYNQLIHYALSVLKSPSICKEVFQHMMQLRQPPLEPDTVTFNTILRHATTQRYDALARAVLTTRQSQNNATEQPPRQASASATPSTKSRTTAASVSDDPSIDMVEARPIRPMIQQIDMAIAQADSYRLVSLLQYVTASGLFLRRYRHEPGHAGVKELIMRIYPALNTQRFARRSAFDPLESHQAVSQQSSAGRLRPKANQASRHAILNPHVLTAALNLAAKAGKTGLALRVWRLIKRTSLQSSLQSPAIDVAKAPWKVPVEAATILMQVLANEAAKVPKIKHKIPSRRPSSPFGTSRMAAHRRTSQSTTHRKYARGWNIVASLRGRSYSGRLRSVGGRYNSAGELGEGLRWRAAQLLAKREYAFLVHHWQVSRSLSSWRRKRLEGWMQPGGNDTAETSPRRAISKLGKDSVARPDSRFYDAVLDVFGRRPGMIQRSRRHATRSQVVSQLRRGYDDAVEKASIASGEPRTRLDSASDETVDHAEGAKTLDKVNGTASAQDAVTSPDPSACSATVDASSEDTLTAPSSSTATLATLSTSQLLHAVVSRITFNSRGRFTSLPPDPFLVRILLDMEALAIDIPVGYRWILAHCSLAAAHRPEMEASELLRNDQAGRSKKTVGAFSPFRGPRIKTVGMVARRPNSAVASAEAAANEKEDARN